MQIPTYFRLDRPVCIASFVRLNREHLTDALNTLAAEMGHTTVADALQNSANNNRGWYTIPQVNELHRLAADLRTRA
ncbi:hypothetical protein ACFU0X_20505 [Streptomyces cellulosae]|uniref:Uncharacterized protein n=1 Tax=Streptomyces cellulosae TaxID=1968 RepID=A0ABW6JJ27_STRCE